MKAATGNRKLPKAPVPKTEEESGAADASQSNTKRASWLWGGVKTALSGVRMLLGIGLFVGTALGVAYGLYRYVSSSPRFALRNLVVAGNKQRSQAELGRIAGVELGQNVFAIDLEEVRRRVLADPWVERCQVSRKLPGTLSLAIVERVPVSIVVLSNQLYLAASDGEVMKRVELGDPSDFVLITGIGGEGDLVRDPVGTRNLVKRAQDLIVEYERSGPARGLPLAEVHVGDDGGFTLIAGKDPVMLSLGKPPFLTKLQRASRVVAEIDRKKAHAKVIFLDNEAHPERVVARFK